MMAKVKTLVISNDPAMLKFLQQNLGENGYHIATTQRTEEDLKEVLDRELPDLVILDIMMPSLDGIEICLRIRQWSQVPIMMLSTWGAGEGKIRGLDLAAESYLTEPFGTDAFRARLREVLQHNFATMNHLLKVSSNAPSGEGNFN